MRLIDANELWKRFDGVLSDLCEREFTGKEILDTIESMPTDFCELKSTNGYKQGIMDSMDILNELLAKKKKKMMETKNADDLYIAQAEVFVLEDLLQKLWIKYNE